MPPKPKSPTPVVTHKHKDKRANIPTEELRDFGIQPTSPTSPTSPTGPTDLLNLILECTGQKKKEKEAKVSTAQALWKPAVNNHSEFGRWDFLEISDPWDAENAIRARSAKAGG